MTDRPATRKKASPAPTEHEPGKITTAQMRHLHALLRDHGITGDNAVHDYLTLAGVTVESRTDIDTVDAARIIADLEAAPVARTLAAAGLTALREAFPPEAIGKLPRSTCQDCSAKDGRKDACERHPNRSTCSVCGNYHNTASTIHLDFVGHADVTARLLAVDPEWTWEPAENGPGGPSISASTDRDGNLWIRLTVLGVTRIGVGDGKNAKERIGDALRNAAMRFGVALDLWAKGDREWAHTEKTGTDRHPDEATGPAPQADPPWTGPSTAESLAALRMHAETAGVDFDAFTAKKRQEHGGITVEELDRMPAAMAYQWERQVAAYLRDNPPEAAPAETAPDAAGEQAPA